MDGLAFVWLSLTVYELLYGLSDILEKVMILIWIIFAVHFLVELLLAPKKTVYLKHNWLTAISLILPVFRIFRFLRFFRYLRGVRSLSLIKILSSINRGMSALSKSLKQKVFIYVLCLTFMVIFLGAAGIINFEKDSAQYFNGYGSALWWSAMMVTTMGTDYFPKSSEGRVLALILAVYGFAIFGYVSASLASYLISKVKKEKHADNIYLELKQIRSELNELKKSVKNES